jgi:hypothetical protein
MDMTLIEYTRSYIAGLKYHKNQETPTKNKIYLCLLDANNQFDTKAVGIYSNKKRIGFVPQVLSKSVHEHLSATPESTAVLCYCFGFTTEKSSQCMYLTFKITPALSNT